LSLLTLLADVDLLGARSPLCLILLVHDHGELHLHAIVLLLQLFDLPLHNLDLIPGVIVSLFLALEELGPLPLLFLVLLHNRLLVVDQPLSTLTFDLQSPLGLGLRLPDLLVCPW
jgi:hypothetical protein